MLPGLLLSSAVAIGAVTAARLLVAFAPIPAMVIALIIGIALNPLAQRRSFQAGIVFCLKSILRWAVALLGLRIALGEIAALGVTTAMLVVVAMVLTLAAGFLLARLFALERAYGALAGAGTAVCGASATLATSIVLPDYKGKEMDVAFVVVAVNALSTLAMVVYPLLCVWLGFDAQTAGIMLGATIHDVAQVVGAGYAVSETAGNTAVIVKLFRVFLMLPACARHRLAVRKASRGNIRRQDPDPALRDRFRRVMRAQQHCGPIPRRCADACMDQASTDRSVDLGPLDRNLGARTRHVADGHRGAGMASRRDSDRHDAGHPGSGDGRTDDTAVKQRRCPRSS